MRIKDLVEEERPREKLLRKGVRTLSTGELLAILLRSGSKYENSTQLGQKILSYKNTHDLPSLSIEQLLQFQGIGMAKACTLIAAIELGKRINVAYVQKDKIDSIEDIAPKYVELLKDSPVEEFHIICLDIRSNIIKEHCITSGISNASLIHPREFFKEAILCNAQGVIAIHNHPSGDPTPSVEDGKVTDMLERAGETIGIPLVDHIIVGTNGYRSTIRKK